MVFSGHWRCGAFYQSVALSTVRSRAVAGLVNGTVIFALPGCNSAVKDGWDKVIFRLLDSCTGPATLAEPMARLKEV